MNEDYEWRILFAASEVERRMASRLGDMFGYRIQHGLPHFSNPAMKLTLSPSLGHLTLGTVISYRLPLRCEVCLLVPSWQSFFATCPEFRVPPNLA